MALKVPFVATNYETYSELGKYGTLVENGYKNWFSALSDMIDNISIYKEKAAGESYEFALEQSSEKGVRRVTLPLYEKLINMDYPI